MARLVLDASVTMAWCFIDEQDEFADRVLEVLVAGGVAVVPSIWSIEVTNAIVIGERRQRVSESEVARFLGLIEALPIDADPQTSSRSFMATLPLARTQRLSAYDAAYLELAMREGAILATLDARLKAAAEQVGVTIFA